MTEKAREGSEGRHPQTHVIRNLWRDGTSLLHEMAGDPPCSMRFEPHEYRAVLTTPMLGPTPNLDRFRLLEVVPRALDADDLYELRVKVDDEDIEAAYALLKDVSDGIQLDGLSLAAALSEALIRYERLVGRMAPLPVEREIGLLGELHVLKHLLDKTSTDAALSAWVGPRGEVHDFLLADAHVECKTTLSPRRRHVITGLDQLTPPVDVPLHLLSIQVARAESLRGVTLAQQVEAVRSMCRGREHVLAPLLEAAGWNPAHASLYSSPWQLRSAAATYLVDDSFPALTRARLAAVPSVEAVTEVTYRLDLTGLSPCRPPAALTTFAADTKELR